MCDKTMEGKQLNLCENLKFVAACNPYRKHSDELVKKLEQAGLGYHVDAGDTTDKLGRVPMRRLVYRVQPLPQSLLPLVWDFGQLNTQVEDLYIRQMVRRYVCTGELPNPAGFIEVVSGILTASQDYMRQKNDECSFVSLRDVGRVLSVMSWFYQQSRGNRTIFDLMDKAGSEFEAEEAFHEEEMKQDIDDITRSLVLALGVCYHSCLKDREDYRTFVTKFFRAPCNLPGGAAVMEREINCCQDVFLDSVQLEKNIARNMALKENVFMMTVCIELRIPLFVIGKPGSSKSLAKTIVSDAMQGNASRHKLFSELKQAQMVSFQCSPLATPEGIVGTFRQCAQFQKDKDLDKYVSTVVLDEVGLAEDSPRMPLKALHPLLEEGCQGEETPEKHNKVAFIGISNWALDPAKMNRGILVQRDVPDLEELKESARGICTADDNGNVLRRIQPLIEPMAKSYLAVFSKASMEKREFFGLRDFYSLVKMVYAFTERSGLDPTWQELTHAVLRNFGGLDQINPVEIFKEHLSKVKHLEEQKNASDPDCSPQGLIEACLFDSNKMQRESRYLLLLTENYGALNILQQEILARQSDIRPITLYGSSFRSDQEYTQVCRNINKIKVCMETGNTVVLLNLENLYESLYDALNQYYVYFGGERYVDLGLGTHRVKCPVHENFRLIVVAEKKTVYDKFPIPLINRLEKHCLTLNNMLSSEQQALVIELETWANKFARTESSHMSMLSNVFMGYHEDTCSAIVTHAWKASQGQINDKILDKIFHASKLLLLWCATPDAVVRLSNSSLGHQEQQTMKKIYREQQAHDSIAEYLKYMIVTESRRQLFAQVTTHSKLLRTGIKRELAVATNIPEGRIMIMDALSSFDTEQQFSNKTQQFLKKCKEKDSMLVVQCDSGDKNANLVACARYCVMDEYETVREKLKARVHIIFIIQLPRIAGSCFTGFQTGVWHSVHIDDLRTDEVILPTVQEMESQSVAELLVSAVGQPYSKDTEQTAEIPSTKDGSTNLGPEAGERTAVHRAHHVDPIDQETVVQVPALQNTSDVDIVISNIEPNLPKQCAVKNLNAQYLILSCVQAALSMVKDTYQNKARTTERVSLVLKLFKDSIGKNGCLEGVCKLIAVALTYKERNMCMTNHWLLDEAAQPENIHKAGTFRLSCLQTLESRISPVLAGIIAYLDTNQNLDILQEDRSTWQHKFWLLVLNAPEALSLKYADLQSPKQRDISEVIVMTTGCDGHMLKGKMPFSWLIRSQLADLLDGTPVPRKYVFQDEVEHRIDRYVNLLSGTGIGKLLDQIQDDRAIQAAVQLYAEDFTHMVYKDNCEKEHTLVVQIIMNRADLMTENKSLLSRLVSVHLAYNNLQLRLVYFHTMNCVWPDLGKIDQDCDKAFPFSALCLLIEDLAPDEGAMNDSESRSQWLKKVYKYRQIIEKVTSLHTEKADGDVVVRARCLWSRVLVVKLFLEHVCAPEDKNELTIKRCMLLWMLLKEETDLKEVKSLKSVQTILTRCSKVVFTTLLGQVDKCCRCEIVVDGPAIGLPCDDIMCDDCLQSFQEGGNTTCPKCKVDLKNNWNPVTRTKNKDEYVLQHCLLKNFSQANQKLQNFQRRCNGFFMDIVSQLCFSENTAPSEAVIEKLLEFVLCSRPGKADAVTGKCGKKFMSILDTGIDPTPGFRSFLLQLMMRTSRVVVTKHLGKYLEEANIVQYKDVYNKGSHYFNLTKLIIHCFENVLLNELPYATGGDVQAGITYLKNAAKCIATKQLTVEKLCGLAETRIGLAITAKYVADIVNQDQSRIEQDVEKLIEEAHRVCTELKTKMPKVYLVKFLIKRYGMNTYQKLHRSKLQILNWIKIRELDANEIVECADRYVICGSLYTRIRDAVTHMINGENVGRFGAVLQELKADQGCLDVMTQLAIHREITNSNLYSPEIRTVTPQVIQTIESYLMEIDMIKDKKLIQALLHNQLGANQLEVHQEETLNLQGIQCLILHFMSVLGKIKGDNTIMKPLMCLMKTPHRCQSYFLPTMPQDDIEDIKEAIAAAGVAERENPVFYRCPNGHPYVIGNCGRPTTQGVCKACGLNIGGERYKLVVGNVQDHGIDQTRTGHILGCSETRDHGPTPERTLTPLACACLRLLTHMAMYAGTLTNSQGVESLIKPEIAAGSGPEFVWQHIQIDLKEIERGVGKCVDDVLLLMHVIINTIMMTQNPVDQINAERIQLTSKQGRNEWEQQFSLKYLEPVLQNVNTTLIQNNQLILLDRRRGADPLLCLLDETDVKQKDVNRGMLQEDPVVWRYREPISLDHLRREFDAKFGSTAKSKQPYKVLQHFLREDKHLRAIKFIPSILKLQRVLLSRYSRRLHKEEASTIKISDLKRDEAAHGIVTLVDDFVRAWELLRGDLKKHVCLTEVGARVVSKEYCSRRITDDLSIAYLLPTTRDMGLCSFALLDFLIRKQNDFLTEYMKATERSKDAVSMVSPNDITTAHLISYDVDRDILPIVLANCTFSFAMGKQTSIEYDFQGIERQLMDRFIFSKSIISIEETLKIELMFYRADVTNAQVLKKLGEKIPQDVLNGAVKVQISNELQSLPDLCTSLDNLDIAISFLTSVGGDPTHNLYDFMRGTLKMENSLISQKARQECQYQHVQSLWLHLNLMKSKRLADHSQPRKSMFDNIEEKYHEALPGDVQESLQKYIKTMSVEKLSQLVEILHEYIVLQVSVRDNTDEEDYVDKETKQLYGWLSGYIEYIDRPSLDMQILHGFPQEILIRHSSHTWTVAYTMLREKTTGHKH